MIAAEWTRVAARICLLLGLSITVAVYPAAQAWADDEDEEEDEEEEDDDDDEDEEEEEDQPPVTAGGLFTKQTFPQAENQRPLTITRKMTELRLGIDINMSATRAFKDFGIGLDGRYGLEDNVELQAGFRTRLNNRTAAAGQSLSFYAAFEGSIVYDLVDFRAGISIPQNVIPATATTEASTSTGFDVEIGFPFRYAPKPEVAVVALDTFMTFNFVGDKYTVVSGTETVELNEKTPDLTPSIGVVVQPLPMLAAIVKAKLIIKDFNTDASNFQIPISLNIQFSPTNLLDIGGEFTFPNLKPGDPDGDGPAEAPKFTDSRFLLLYGQVRF